MASKRLLFGCIVLIAFTGARTALAGQTGGFAYAANCGSPCDGFAPGSVSAYRIEATGALTPVGSPVPAGMASHSVAVDPTGQFAYVANLGSNDVSAYSISTTGTLTPIDGSPFLAGVNPVSVTVDPKGQFVYVANANSNDLSAYAIIVIGGAGGLMPVSGSPFPAGVSPLSVTVDPKSSLDNGGS